MNITAYTNHERINIMKAHGTGITVEFAPNSKKKKKNQRQ